MIKIIRCYVSPLLCPLPQLDATTPPSHKQILGCMHLPREPQRLTQIAVKYERYLGDLKYAYYMQV